MYSHTLSLHDALPMSGVARRLERVAGTIELAAAVIFVTCHGTPAVLVEVEPPFGIDVTLAGLERGLDHPHAMQFPADKVRIDVIGREHLIGLGRSEEHTSELQSLMRISYAVF